MTGVPPPPSPSSRLETADPASRSCRPLLRMLSVPKKIPPSEVLASPVNPCPGPLGPREVPPWARTATIKYMPLRKDLQGIPQNSWKPFKPCPLRLPSLRGPRQLEKRSLGVRLPGSSGILSCVRPDSSRVGARLSVQKLGIFLLTKRWDNDYPSII